MKYPVLRTVLAPVLILAVALVFLPPSNPAQAHWRNYCADDVKIKWANNSGVSWTYPARWNGTKYLRATQAAITNINNRVSGDWGMWPGGAASGIHWGSNAYGSAVARGFTRTSWNDDCHLLVADVRYNTSRVSHFGHKRLKAVAVHEAGHSYGVGHWKGCDPDTMMVKTWKCLWRTHRINTMKAHDERDVRNTY